MKLPNGYGSVYKLSGKRRKPYIVRKTIGWDDSGKQLFANLGYYKTRQEALQALAAYNDNPYDLQMPQTTFDQIVEKYVEMNVAHPFREGNGRSTRIWLDAIFKKELQQVVDWSKIDKEDYLLAMERSPIRDTEIKLLLKKALTSQINDRDVYMKGIDASYHYEGYHVYKIAEINSKQ